jgi:hypothetical protein
MPHQPLVIIDLAEETTRLGEVAAMLVAGFAEHWPDAWPNAGAALDEVRE